MSAEVEVLGEDKVNVKGEEIARCARRRSVARHQGCGAAPLAGRCARRPLGTQKGAVSFVVVGRGAADGRARCAWLRCAAISSSLTPLRSSPSWRRCSRRFSARWTLTATVRSQRKRRSNSGARILQR
eukprot:2313214-Prymnesium_polylepis.1